MTSDSERISQKLGVIHIKLAVFNGVIVAILAFFCGASAGWAFAQRTAAPAVARGVGGFGLILFLVLVYLYRRSEGLLND